MHSFNHCQIIPSKLFCIMFQYQLILNLEKIQRYWGGLAFCGVSSTPEIFIFIAFLGHFFGLWGLIKAKIFRKFSNKVRKFLAGWLKLAGYWLAGWLAGWQLA